MISGYDISPFIPIDCAHGTRRRRWSRGDVQNPSRDLLRPLRRGEIPDRGGDVKEGLSAKVDGRRRKISR